MNSTVSDPSVKKDPAPGLQDWIITVSEVKQSSVIAVTM